MKKGILLAGKKTLGKKDELYRLLLEELGTNRKSLMEDKIDNQLFILDGIDERLKEESLKKMIESFLTLFPNAQIAVSLDSIELLSKEDVGFAKETFEIYYRLEKNSYIKMDSDEVFVEGIPVRLELLSNMTCSPQFFTDICENTLQKAMAILTALHGSHVTLEQLRTLLSNSQGKGEAMVLQASKEVKLDEYERKNLSDTCMWFMHDYFTGAKGSRSATKTYGHTEQLRILLDKLAS